MTHERLTKLKEVMNHTAAREALIEDWRECVRQKCPNALNTNPTFQEWTIDKLAELHTTVSVLLDLLEVDVDNQEAKLEDESSHESGAIPDDEPESESAAAGGDEVKIKSEAISSDESGHRSEANGLDEPRTASEAQSAADVPDESSTQSEARGSDGP